jgi:hypothetical protein
MTRNRTSVAAYAVTFVVAQLAAPELEENCK